MTYNDYIYAQTKKYQKKYGFEIGTGKHDAWNNESDAFKHTFMSADLALRYTVGLSKYAADKHEEDGNLKMGQSKGEENMDRWNNRQGRQIAEKIKKEIKNPIMLKAYIFSGKLEDRIADEVMKKMKKGDLITNPNDKRKFIETTKKNTIKNSEKFDAQIKRF